MRNSTAYFVFILILASIFAVSCENRSIASVKTEEELASALAKGGEIVLQDDIVVTDTLVVSNDSVLNMNGKTLSNTDDIWVDTEEVDKWSLISVRDSAKLVIKGNGKLLAKENDCYALDAIDGSIVIEDGTFRGNLSAVYVFKGSLEVKGGSFSILQKDPSDDPNRFLLNCYDQNRAEGTASIKVSGGVFEAFDPGNNKAEGEGTNFLAEGYKSVANEEGSEYSVSKN